jgi:DNA-binding transcriptional LysR family regulator
VLLESVRSGSRQVALVGVAGAPPAGLSSHVLVSEGLVAAVPAGHPLATRISVDLVTLCAYEMICLPVGTGIRAVLDQACAAKGLRPGVSLQASAPGAVADLAARGLGVAVLSASMATGFGDLTAVTIDGLGAPALLAVVWREQSTLIGAFIRELA